MFKQKTLFKRFLSHFQILKFPSFEFDKLKVIAQILFKSFNNDKSGDKKDDIFISDLLDFHKIWASQSEWI